ncbi:hypothetical protein B0H13DRAFT_2329840 [Mycena leptocephala]|nr:hypothetical protein B0H13DRAFT_2329840 [Mycena leptocephala]
MATTGIFGAGVDQRVLDVVHCDVPWNMVDLIQEQNRGAVMFIPEGRPPIDCPESAPFGSHLLVPWAMDAHECRRVKMSLFLDGVSILCFDVPSGVLCDICCTEVVSPTREVPLIAEETQIAPADYAPPLILDDIVNPAPTDKGKGRAHHGPLLASSVPVRASGVVRDSSQREVFGVFNGQPAIVPPMQVSHTCYIHETQPFIGVTLDPPQQNSSSLSSNSIAQTTLALQPTPRAPTRVSRSPPRLDHKIFSTRTSPNASSTAAGAPARKQQAPSQQRQTEAASGASLPAKTKTRRYYPNLSLSNAGAHNPPSLAAASSAHPPQYNAVAGPSRITSTNTPAPRAGLAIEVESLRQRNEREKVDTMYSDISKMLECLSSGCIACWARGLDDWNFHTIDEREENVASKHDSHWARWHGTSFKVHGHCWNCLRKQSKGTHPFLPVVADCPYRDIIKIAVYTLALSPPSDLDRASNDPNSPLNVLRVFHTLGIRRNLLEVSVPLIPRYRSDDSEMEYEHEYND